MRGLDHVEGKNCSEKKNSRSLRSLLSVRVEMDTDTAQQGRVMLLAAMCAAVVAGLVAGFSQKRSSGPRGLRNLGNTCYINAILQAFASCPSLIDYAKFVGSASDSCMLAQACFNVCVQLNTVSNGQASDELISPDLICERVFAASALRSGMQEDAHEFMELMLELMERELVHAHTRRMLSGGSLHDAVPEHAEADGTLNGYNRAAAGHRLSSTRGAGSGRDGGRAGAVGDGAGQGPTNALEPPRRAGPRPSLLRRAISLGKPVHVLSAGPTPALPITFTSLLNPFRFTLATHRTCTVCKRAKPLRLAKQCVLTVSFNPATLMLGRKHLSSLLAENHVPEFLNDVECEHCSKAKGLPVLRSFVQRTTMAACPQILCVHINRLVYTPSGLVKVSEPVQLNEQLNLDVLCGAPIHYSLCAVIVHLGGAKAGHYTCFRRRGSSWFRISDDDVRRAAPSEALRSNPSLVFFERINTPDPLAIQPTPPAAAAAAAPAPASAPATLPPAGAAVAGRAATTDSKGSPPHRRRAAATLSLSSVPPPVPLTDIASDPSNHLTASFSRRA